MDRDRHRPCSAAARRVLLGAAVACAVGLVAAGPASAHAILESTIPADRAQVATSLSEVTLEFSENVSAVVGAVRVLNSSGDRVDTGKIRVDGHVVHTPLRPSLPDGPYIVAWRVISADSHPVRGTFTFAVGSGAVADDAAIASVFGADADRTPQIAAAVARAMAYLGALLAAGGALFLALVHEDGPRPTFAGRAIAAGAGLGAAGVLLALLLQADLATGLGIGSLFKSSVRGDVLGEGVGWSTAITLVGLAELLVALRLTGRVARVALVLGALATVGGFAAAGHSTQATPAWLMSTADVVHVSAGAAWFGGLVLLVLVVRRRSGADPGVAARVVGRFSRLATVSILALGATGVMLAWKEVGSVGALTSTTYGRLLMLKVGVVVAVASVGAYNHFVLVPAVADGTPREASWRRLRRTLGFEGAGLVCVLGVTAVLVNVVPAATLASGPFAETTAFGSGTVQVVVDPPRTGQTSIHLYLLDAAGRALTADDGGPLDVTLELSLPSADIGPITRMPERAGPGHFQLDGHDLSIAGHWQITVRAQMSKFQDETATIEVPIRS